VERSDKANVGGKVPLIHLLMIALAIDKNDGPPMDGLIAGVDSLDGLLNATPELGVAGNARAAGRGDLDHGEALAIPGVVFEELADGLKALHDSLGVVEPVNP
jgi:hypothetical protein